MARINLKNFYSWIKQDEFVDITDDMLEALKAADRQEATYKHRIYYHKARYSLDVGDGIENDAIVRPETPKEIYFRKLAMERLYANIGQLTEIQQRRIKAHYFDGLKFCKIAKIVVQNKHFAALKIFIYHILLFVR